MRPEPNRILVIQTAFIGDVILITPLIRETKRLFPKARVDALVIPQTQGILAGNPHLDTLHTFDKRGNKVLAFISIVWKLRKCKYDLAISPHSSMTTSWITRLAGIPERLGYDRWRQAKHLTLKVATDDQTLKVDKNLSLLSVFGHEGPDHQTELFPGDNDIRIAHTLLANAGPSGKPLVAIAPGSVWNTKRWPAEHYVTLTRQLFSRGIHMVFMGALNERDLCSQIISQAGINAANLAGKLSLLGSAEAMGKCDLVICNDSGALHLANAMGTTVFAFFGPTVRELGYFPFREHDHVFEVDHLDCRPCGTHGHDTCPQGHFRCMLEIEPQVVAERVLAKLEHTT